jgi:site-specific DNA-methyltransferase (adenine-specific)
MTREMDQPMVVQSDAIDFLIGEPDGKYDFIYIDPPYYCQRDFGQFNDNWENVGEYISMLKPLFIQSKRVLKDHGNICVHVDWHGAHHVRVALEEVFGEDNFRNEIIWCYSSGGASKRHFSRKHDNLFVFSKDADKCKFNVQREPYPRDYGDRDGFHPDGRIMNDWWQIGILSTTAKERNGYPTQKPLELLKRLLKSYTDEGDLVLDFFCGSGTTGEAAMQMNRRFVLVDKNPEACRIARQRTAKNGLDLLFDDGNKEVS